MVPTLLYWPAVAMPVVWNTQVSPGSSSLFAAAAIAGVEAPGLGHRRRVDAGDVVGDGDVAERDVAAGGRDIVGPGDGAADGHNGTVGRAGDGRIVVVGVVRRLDRSGSSGVSPK